LWYRDARPQHIYDAAIEAASLGKLQMLTMPKPYYHEGTPEWERLTRQSMAMAYACGANTLLPFDVYIPNPSLIRYYGSKEEASMKGAVTLREDDTGKAMRIMIEKPSDTMRDLQLVQDFAVRNGGYYDLRFSARAEKPITILVKLQEPSKPFRTLRAIACALDREWKEFSVLGYNTDRKREASWSRSMSCRLQFDLGRVTAGNVVWLDDVQLEEDWLE
jgi:hypothetical protein